MTINIISTGSYLPTKKITNQELSNYLETNNDWIVSHTGIEKRHIAEKTESTAEMAYKASLNAIKKANMQTTDLDLIIVATTTNEYIFPACATKLQNLLNCQCPAFDIQAVCAGFIFALSTAYGFLTSNQASNILVVGVDKMSSIVDWQDRSTAILFGDGAGAVIIKQQKSKQSFFNLGSDGSYYNILYTKIEEQIVKKLKMNGHAVFKNAVNNMSKSINQILQNSKKSIDDIDWFIPHQANIRIINLLAQKIKISHDKIIKTVNRHANTSAASIPLALDYANSKNLFQKNQSIICSAIGGGLSWGSVLFQW